MKFSERLASLGFKSYDEYLSSPIWIDFKKRYVEAGCRTTCVVCDTKPVQLHHTTYFRLGSERFDDVTPVCRSHHVAIHDWLKSSGRIFVGYTHEAVTVLRGGVVGACVLPRTHKKHRKKKRSRWQRAVDLVVGCMDPKDQLDVLRARLRLVVRTAQELEVGDLFFREGRLRQLFRLVQKLERIARRDKKREEKKKSLPPKPVKPTKIKEPKEFRMFNSLGLPLCPACGHNPRKASNDRCGRCIRENRPKRPQVRN